MITVRRAEKRGWANLGWLDSRHTFSFGDYVDPRHMGFGPLRVINEDRVVPGAGFGTHGHQDMEIISYVLAGALEHQDSLGSGAVLRPGDVQVMSAGTGVRHSEFNPSQDEGVHFLQIWIQPERQGLPPRYDQKHFPPEERTGRWCLLVSSDGRDGSLVIHQDARVYAALLERRQEISHALAPGRRAWLQVARGEVEIDGHRLHVGDGAALETSGDIALSARSDGAEILLFDLP